MEKGKKLTKKISKKTTQTFLELAREILAHLPQRSQEILKKRYGLASGKLETLEKIGSDYQITRERVRQIISDSIKKITKIANENAFKLAEERIILEISKRDGIISEEYLFQKLALGNLREEKAIAFFALCSERIMEVENKELLKKAWSVSGDILAKVENFSKLAKDIFSLSKVPLSDVEIVERITKQRPEMTKNQVLSYLDVLSELSKNKFGKWGFTHWMEINPKGTRERIYLILKEENRPLHFTEITKFIDTFGISKRKSHIQTVHNELIKDDRFVLIGRGLYALREWGYVPGTIKEVIKRILEKSGQSMTKEELLVEIAKSRQVKKTTVMINLNNKKEFVKQDNRYGLKK
ncbi:MAG: HTH domain-containing protein [Parcubacteria group bacterium]|jgi:DNA-directed RNA polymerase delta subunit